MFCTHCGERAPEGAHECPSCGRTVRPEPARPAAEWTQRLGASSSDAVSTLKGLLLDPVASLPDAYQALGPVRARAVGALLCVTFALAAATGLTLGARRWLGSIVVFVGSGFEVFVKSFFTFLLIPASFVLAGLAVRKILRSSEGVVADVFTAGAALAPLGAAILVSGLLGSGSGAIVGLLFLFASTYMVLILYSGLSGVGRMTPRASAPAVPVLILAAAWITQLVLAVLF